MSELYSNYLQIEMVYEVVQNYYSQFNEKQDGYDLNDFSEYLKQDTNLNQTTKTNIISICQHIINNKKHYYYFDKFNSPWMKPQMNMIKWIKHCSHPCPIITIAENNQRINNFNTTNFDHSLLKYKTNDLISSNLKNVIPNTIYLAKSNTNFIQFQYYFDQFILKKSSQISFLSSTKTKLTLDEIIQTFNINSKGSSNFYCLQYSKMIRNKFDLNLLIQLSPITSRTLLNGSKIKGIKFKCQLIQSQLIWDTMTISEQIIYYKLSRYLTNLVIKSGNCIWNQHYYYQYPINFAKDVVESNNNIYHAFINYSATKPIHSISEYYSNSSKISPKIHNKLFKYFSDKTGIKYIKSNCNPFTSHLFWIGASVHKTVISQEYKKKIYSQIHSWKINGVPPGIHYDKSNEDEKKDIRWKFFINYRYKYRINKHISTTQINKANLKAAGLRNIKNCRSIPKWLTKLIQHLKKIRFIDPNVEINQIGINYYFNNKSKPIYNSIDPHLEDDKFSVVYSISIYKNPDSPTYLSFGLNLNYSCGDTKIIMNDCDGIKLKSLCY